MTIEQIITSVAAVTGGYSLPSFYRDTRKLKLKPAGIRQKPQQYPPTAVNAILAARGFESAFAPMMPAAKRGTITSIAELKREKRNAISRRLNQTKKGTK